MRVIDLNGAWRMRRAGSGAWHEARVPGSVFADLLSDGTLPDPYFRDNEDAALALSREDFEYTRAFAVEPRALAHDRVVLRCDGLDTLAAISLNGREIARTANMHRTWELDAKQALREGQNEITILFSSPTRFVEREQREHPLWGATGDFSVGGYYFLRKAACMFGWDWGPKMPDSGIWRDVGIDCYDAARIRDVRVDQRHGAGTAALAVEVEAEAWSDDAFVVEAVVTAPDGERFTARGGLDRAGPRCGIPLVIPNPRLWWPSGLGPQPLYAVRVVLRGAGGAELDSRRMSVGLRTLVVRQEADEWGRSFAIEVNGAPIFAKGADYIPEDGVLGRLSPQRTERLLRDCAAANFNCVRVWGGGVYPPDRFYELCDGLGLLVWQDLMFACSPYPSDARFAADVECEIADTIRRIRHHACIALWCGNNEIEWIIDNRTRRSSLHYHEDSDPRLPPPESLREPYRALFEGVIPRAVAALDPGRLYWPSSPSSGGGFDDPNDQNRGDSHYWEVWHGMKPFTDYRGRYFRFCSELGFESFPCMRTVEAFTLPEDRNAFSRVMERHQKNPAGNGLILRYMADTFKYPKDFRSLLYASQLLQAEAMRYGVEHWRANRGRCMGAIYWQLNDCWPAVSWASIDYFGRWKALHYLARRFFAPVLLSAREEGAVVELFLANDTRDRVEGVVEWSLRDRGSAVLRRGEEHAAVGPLSAARCARLDFSGELDEAAMRRTYLELRLLVAGTAVGGGTALFVKPKHFELADPRIRFSVRSGGDRFVVTLASRAFAKFVELDVDGADCVFSDNYFDLSAGRPVEVSLPRERLSENLTRARFARRLRVRSLYDIEERRG